MAAIKGKINPWQPVAGERSYEVFNGGSSADRLFRSSLDGTNELLLGRKNDAYQAGPALG